jgi:hypothetical protein
MTNKLLRRYTEFAPLVYLLQTRSLTLLSPKAWDDKNDTYYLDAYKTKEKCKSLLAVCFTEASETYHHWRVFTGGSSGACIVFDRGKLLAHVASISGIRTGSVIYRKIDEIRKRKPAPGELPFVKRHPYRDEREFRIIYENSKLALDSKDFPIGLECISKVVLNPWIPKPLFGSVRDLIRSINGCAELRVMTTTLVDNEEWKRLSHLVV